MEYSDYTSVMGLLRGKLLIAYREAGLPDRVLQMGLVSILYFG